MKTMKVLFICLLSAMLFVCEDAFGREKEGSMRKSEPYLFKEWSASKKDSMFIYTAYSDNYYVINGRKVALKYIYGGVGTNFIQTSFEFSDRTAESSKNKIVPSPDWKKVKCNVIWNDGSTCVFVISSNGKMLYAGNELKKDEKGNYMIPSTNEFQKKLNEQKKFTITVLVTNGKSYEYKFDVSKFESIDVD